MSLKVKSLVELNSAFLMLSCRKENYKTLLNDWNQMLDFYPILCDLWSDVLETKGKLHEALETLDKQDQMPYGEPHTVSGTDRYIILFTQKYFQKLAETRRAIIIHELGHFYVYKTGLLKNLRLKWPDGMNMFEFFVGTVKQDPTWYNKNEQWLRKLYDDYVFDILKIPGEIYANQWVKENFIDTLNLVVGGQLEQYRYIVSNIDTRIRTKMIRFPLFAIILRLEGLLMLTNGITKNLEDETRHLLRLSWEKMSKFLNRREVENFKKTKQEIMRVCSSVRTSNDDLFSLFQSYVNMSILVPADFHEGPT